jgi:multidrug resistance efflux pump
LRNELGTIKNEVTRLISKGHGSAVSQEKKCNRMERAREDYATKSSSINENCASFESKNPENEEELKKLSTYLDKIKIELKETLNR